MKTSGHIEIKIKVKHARSRAFHDAQIMFSYFDHAAAPEDLTRHQDMHRLGWCKVHNEQFWPKGHSDRQRLVSVGICPECDTWMGLWRNRDDSTIARIGGHHFILMSQLEDYVVKDTDTLQDISNRYKTNNADKAFGGRQAIIRFHDGRTVFTDNLYHQGEIPEHFASAMPNNAEFIKL